MATTLDAKILIKTGEGNPGTVLDTGELGFDVSNNIVYIGTAVGENPLTLYPQDETASVEDVSTRVYANEQFIVILDGSVGELTSLVNIHEASIGDLYNYTLDLSTRIDNFSPDQDPSIADLYTEVGYVDSSVSSLSSSYNEFVTGPYANLDSAVYTLGQTSDRHDGSINALFANKADQTSVDSSLADVYTAIENIPQDGSIPYLYGYTLDLSTRLDNFSPDQDASIADLYVTKVDSSIIFADGADTVYKYITNKTGDGILNLRAGRNIDGLGYLYADVSISYQAINLYLNNIPTRYFRIDPDGIYANSAIQYEGVTENLGSGLISGNFAKTQFVLDSSIYPEVPESLTGEQPIFYREGYLFSRSPINPINLVDTGGADPVFSETNSLDGITFDATNFGTDWTGDLATGFTHAGQNDSSLWTTDFVTVPGLAYTLTATITKSTNGRIVFYVGGASTTQTITSNRTITATLVAEDESGFSVTLNNSVGTYFEGSITDMSLKALITGPSDIFTLYESDGTTKRLGIKNPKYTTGTPGIIISNDDYPNLYLYNSTLVGTDNMSDSSVYMMSGSVIMGMLNLPKCPRTVSDNIFGRINLSAYEGNSSGNNIFGSSNMIAALYNAGSNSVLGTLSFRYCTSIGVLNIAIGNSNFERYTGNNQLKDVGNANIGIGYWNWSKEESPSNEIIIGNYSTGHGSNTVTIGQDSTRDPGSAITGTYLYGDLYLNEENIKDILLPNASLGTTLYWNEGLLEASMYVPVQDASIEDLYSSKLSKTESDGLTIIDGSIAIGDYANGNYLEIYSDGTIRAHGTATGFDDLFVPLVQSKQGSTDLPNFDYDEVAYMFPQNDATEILYFQVQLPHRWKEGSRLYPHVHYRQDVSTLIPTFKLDYKIASIGGSFNSDWATYTMDTSVVGWVDSSTHQLNKGADGVDASTYTKSAIMLCKLYRDDNVAIGDCPTYQFDIHYEVDGLGSETEFTKI